MKLNVRKLLLITLLCFIVLSSILTLISNRFKDKYHRNIKYLQKKIGYHKDFQYYIPVVYDSSQFEKYIIFYENIADGKLSTEYNFDHETIPNNSEVFVLGYQSDSTLVKIGCYYKKGGFLNFFEGYIHSSALVDTISRSEIPQLIP